MRVKDQRTVWGTCLLVLGLVSISISHVSSYRQSAQDGWTDSMSSRGQRNGDHKLLNQALDAFHQASHLERALKKSERAVSAQTKELRSELEKAKATAANTGQSKYFKREEQLDEELMRQAERETRRDKRLVRQAEDEMKGDKKFLEQAYGIKNLDDGSSTCPEHRCHQAKATGLRPSECVVPSGSCPTIRCYDYISSGSCGSQTICTRASTRNPDCEESGKMRWLKKSCPSMSCSLAQQLGSTPDFCTTTQADGPCPQLSCFHYMQMGSCRSDSGFDDGSRVCMKPEIADLACLDDKASTRLLRASKQPRGAKTSRMSRIGYKAFKWMAAVMILTTCLACGMFFAFKRYGPGLGRGMKPAPVPAYYGRL